MGQFNMNIAPEFEKTLEEFMRVRKIKTKSEAIRTAVEEGLSHAKRSAQTTDFEQWLGLGLSEAPNPTPLFSSDSELWKRDGNGR